MLKGFGGDQRKRKSKADGELPNHFGIECHHINARLSKTLEDIGEFQGGKLFLILFYCLQAIWCRFRYGVENFYCVPAPGKSEVRCASRSTLNLCEIVRMRQS